jgi:hypothetical protein
MLPIRWILPVGGVLLAIAVLALAFAAPDGSQMPNAAPLRSAFIEWGERPEWRQFIIFSAIQRRADELNKLRELPDTPTRTDDAPVAPAVAGLAADHSNPEDNDETGVNVQTPAATVPVDIGESFSIEYPVAPSEEKPPVIKTPQRVKSRNQNRVKGVQHVRRRARPLASGEQLPFGNETGQRPAVNTNNYFGNQTWQTTTPNAGNY